MPRKLYKDRLIKVSVFNDITSDERVLEFFDPAISEDEPAVVVSNIDTSWSGAQLSTNPRISGVPVDFLAWVLQTAQCMTRE